MKPTEVSGLAALGYAVKTGRNKKGDLDSSFLLRLIDSRSGKRIAAAVVAGKGPKRGRRTTSHLKGAAHIVAWARDSE